MENENYFVSKKFLAFVCALSRGEYRAERNERSKVRKENQPLDMFHCAQLCFSICVLFLHCEKGKNWVSRKGQ